MARIYIKRSLGPRLLRSDEIEAVVRASHPAPLSTPLLGRASVLAAVHDFMARQHNVVLLGPRDVGKTAIIQAIIATMSPCNLFVLDPFTGVSPHSAGQIRRIMERGIPCIAATRTLDRAEMGAVRRLAFRFTTVRVPPLSAHWIKRLLSAAYDQQLNDTVVPSEWTNAIVRLAEGRPGLALALVHAARRWRDQRGVLPSPSTAYIEASIHRVELFRGRDGVGHGEPLPDGTA